MASGASRPSKHWPVVAASAVIVFEGAVYNAVFLERLLPAAGKSGLAHSLRLLFNALWGLSLWSYAVASTADPGFLPDAWRRFVRDAGHMLPVVAPRLEWQPGKATYCERCRLPRPDRAHHCSICQACVLRMDHHCSWIGNCVGFGNHKAFLLLLVYSWFASFVGLTSVTPDLVRVGRDLWMRSETELLSEAELNLFLVFSGLAAVLVVALTLMVAIHCLLACQNMTAIEDNYHNMSNPFDQGSALENLKQVFGMCGLDWLLPVKPFRPLSDGVSFVRKGERRDLDALLGVTGSEVEAEIYWRFRYDVPIPVDYEAGRSTTEAAPPSAERDSPRNFRQHFACCYRQRVGKAQRFQWLGGGDLRGRVLIGL